MVAYIGHQIRTSSPKSHPHRGFIVRPTFACLAALVPACAGPQVTYRPAFHQTRQICAFTDDDLLAVPSTSARLPNPACVDAMNLDFGADVPAFLRHDGLDSPYSIVQGDPHLAKTPYGLLLLNARALLLAKLPDLHEIQPSPLISSEFLDALAAVSEQTGDTNLAPLLYDFAASVIERSSPGDSQGARASFSSEARTLTISAGTEDPIVLGTLLIHESRHLWEAHGSCPWDPEASCDPDSGGAYGFGLSAKVLLRRSHTEPELLATLDSSIPHLFHRIESLCQEDGSLLPEWRTTSPEHW
jgi:hypothetical protein